MKRVLFAFLAVAAISSFSGCCGSGCGGGCGGGGSCLDRLFCGNFWCRNGCGGGCQDSCGCGDDCGCDSGCDDCGCGGGDGYAEYGGGGGGGCGCGGGGGAYEGSMPVAQKVRGVHEDMRYAQGPPASGVAYPYYTTRGPRDYLARNPRSIGP